MEIKSIIRDSMWEDFNSSSIEDCNINKNMWDIDGLLQDNGIKPTNLHKFYANYVIDGILQFLTNPV